LVTYTMTSFLGGNELDDVPLHVIHLDQDDPKKCTSRRMQRFGHCRIHTDIRRSPKRGILLDPLAGLLLGPDDRSDIERGGALVGLDCSWKQIDESIEYLNKRTRLNGRTLPVVLAANPVSWGKPGRLSNAEAFAVSLVLLGRWEQAHRIMQPFNYSDQFFQLNEQPLEAYSNATTNDQLAELQWEFFDKPDSE
jgi:pre-rRNA-processing protein TSR3